MLNTFEVNKVLIIAPLRVARDTWPAEIEKWDHLKNLDISIVVGDVKTRIAAVHHPAMIYVVNRENVKWLVEYYEKNGMRWDFSMVVIDELSSFKNYQSQRFKFLRKVRPYVKRWVGLTGTPSSNGLMDLWAEIGILDGGERLGKFIGRYREAYFKAASMNPSSGVVFQYKPKEGAEELIYQRISDITISMKALDYLNMPDCIPTRYEVEMNSEERKLYDMLKQDLLIPLKDGDIDAANAASLTGKLLQMSNGAVYDENGKEQTIIMGCYGIGVSRVVAACIEQNNDGDGIAFPPPLAPFDLELLNLDPKNADTAAKADELYDLLTGMGLDVLLDDREERPGVKFKDADLVGLPMQVVVGGKGLARGIVHGAA